MTKAKPAARSGRERTRAYRERLRAQGLRPKQIWVPDTSDPAFREEIRRQSLAANAADAEDDIMDWIEAAQADMDWDA